jgi:protein N-terminal methyltransferase
MEDGSQHLFTHAVQKILPEHLWKKELGEDGTHTAWYSKAVEYWDKQEASYNGVLGGYGCVSSIDIRDSKALLLKVCKRFYLSSLGLKRI